MRQLEPELFEELLHEPLPKCNAPRRSDWEDAPQRHANPPGPFTTAELIPTGTVERVVNTVRGNQACLSRASRGENGPAAARKIRPEALILEQHEALNPCGWGYTWRKQRDVDLWDVVQPSSWPHDPPSCSLDAARLKKDAEQLGFTDMQFVAWCCHGFPGSNLPSGERAVIGYPHAGAIKNPRMVTDADERDASEGWLTQSSEFPEFWPCYADCINVVVQHGKPRMTIDKSIRLSSTTHPTQVDSYNDLIDLIAEREQIGGLALPRVASFWRAAAILMTCGLPVLVGKFDLFAYFRQHGKQRAAVHQSARSLESLVRFDLRINFGEQDGMDHCCRGSEAIAFFVRLELTRLQTEYPPREQAAVEWLARRMALERPADESSDQLGRFTASWFFMVFVDDAGLAAISYAMCRRDGTRISNADGSPQMSGDTFLKAAAAICQRYGHGTPDKKFFPMARQLELLGEYGDLDTGHRTLPEGRAELYAGNIDKLLSEAKTMPNGATAVDDVLLKSIVHKLIYATTFYPLGKTKLFYMKKTRKTDALLTSRGRIIGSKTKLELSWWRLQLQRATTPSVPLAPRYGFPTSSDTTIVVYSDASRELDSPETSGFGAWAIVSGIFIRIYGLWTVSEMQLYSINVLEAHASSGGTHRIQQRARELGNAATHSLAFIDNTSAESVAENGRPQAEGLHLVNERRLAWTQQMGVMQAADRITSEDNVVADRLSRQEIAAATAFAIELGLPIETLQLTHEQRTLEGITPTWPSPQL